MNYFFILVIKPLSKVTLLTDLVCDSLNKLYYIMHYVKIFAPLLTVVKAAIYQGIAEDFAPYWYHNGYIGHITSQAVINDVQYVGTPPGV